MLQIQSVCINFSKTIAKRKITLIRHMGQLMAFLCVRSYTLGSTEPVMERHTKPPPPTPPGLTLPSASLLQASAVIPLASIHFIQYFLKHLLHAGHFCELFAKSDSSKHPEAEGSRFGFPIPQVAGE